VVGGSAADVVLVTVTVLVRVDNEDVELRDVVVGVVGRVDDDEVVGVLDVRDEVVEVGRVDEVVFVDVLDVVGPVRAELRIVVRGFVEI
jgi:hypothetical protein